MTRMLEVPLAHQLPKAHAVRLGVTEERDFSPGEKITLPDAGARMLLEAGYLQADPRKQEDRDRILNSTVPAPPAGGSAGPAAAAGTGEKPAGK